MYEWSRMTRLERERTLRARIERGHPWHSPPSEVSENDCYHVTAACYGHAPIIGVSQERLSLFRDELLHNLEREKIVVSAWCFLTNHYHVLAWASDLKRLRFVIGRLHGRTAFAWNRQDEAAGRKVWTACADRGIRSERHFWTTVNYIHNNPVHHRLVETWQEWPFSSAVEFLEAHGREEAMRIWKEYPLLDYGKGWDEP